MEELVKCCRLCLSEKADVLRPIFDETTNDLQLSQKILDHLNIAISISDQATTVVCEECIDKITSWINYKEQCVENQKKFANFTIVPEDSSPKFPTPPAEPEMLQQHAPGNSVFIPSGEMVHIKEEPIDNDVLDDDTPPCILEGQPENISVVPEIMEQLLEPAEMPVYVKSEPVDMDESIEHEYNMENGVDEIVRDPDINRKCSVCGKFFSNTGNRKKHERVQHGLHPTVCVSSSGVTSELTNGEGSFDATKNDQQKVLYGMSMKLLKESTGEIASEELSKIELSYIEKCKAMVSMHKSLVCACHNVPHQNLKGLLSHLRALRIWFPVFTCYNCMITFTDRSTFTRHISRCSSQSLNTITKLSNLDKRSEVKTRLYQNFKCTICKFMYSFHEDFCSHVDQDHSILQFPVHCPCGRVFEEVEEYKDHVYVSCLVEFYCDICFITTKTLDEFKKHASAVHDESEGFILLQDDNYKVRKPSMHTSPSTSGVDEAAILTGKRERKASIRAPFTLDDESQEEMSSKGSYYAKTDNRICPVCYKEYSSYKNMMRHYKTHKENESYSHQDQDMDLENEESFYSCPDCGGMFNNLEWKVHLAEKHPSKPCNECGKLFQFRTELEQHRSVHLNIKIYISKNNSYKSTMLSPGADKIEGPDGEVMLNCDKCDVMFPNEEDLMNHKLSHELEENVHEPNAMDQDNDGELKYKTDIKKEIIDNMETDIDVVETAKKFKCEPCFEEFDNYSSLWEHNKMRHPEKKTPSGNTYPKACEECGKVCTTGAAFYRHKQIHVPQDAGGIYSNFARKKPPLDNAQEESYHTCKRCFKVFSSKYNLKNHLKCHGINPMATNKKLLRKIVCNICQQVFASNEDLISHRQESHNGESGSQDEMEDSLLFTCDICVMTFNNKAALKKHKEKHFAETKKSVYCKYCKIPFESTAHLSQHMLVEHDERNKKKVIKEVGQADAYACNICNKTFQSAGALTTHTGWHKRAQNENNTKMLQKYAPPKQNNVVIKEEPSDEPKYQCSTCLAELPNDTALQVHILEKHRSVSAIMLIPRCNTCNKDFATQDEYETHKRLHDFLERQKQHEQNMLVQQQDSPQAATSKPKSFPCKHCNAAFSRSDTLGIHMRQYHKDYVLTEFRCPHCDRVFEKQNSLTIHLKVHEKQRTMTTPTAKPLFSCSICSMGFDLPKDLRAHTISAHPF